MTNQSPTDEQAAATALPAVSADRADVARSAGETAPGVVVPSVVYLLADHLDAVLARGEDLMACSWRPDRTARCPATIASHQDAQRDVVRAIRTHELLLISRALKARERSRELASRDERFAPLARVFAAATAALEDAAREAGDLTAEQFDAGDGILAYMRSRGMVAKDSADLGDCGAIVVTEKFLVARRIELEVILDLVAAFLDALELHFDIYPEAVEPHAEAEDAEPSVARATAGEAAVEEDASPPAAAVTAVSSLIERLSSAQQT